MAPQTVYCAIDYPPGVNEIAATGLTALPNRKVRPMRIVEAAATMECRPTQSIEYPGRSIIVGHVVIMWVRDVCIDATRKENHAIRMDNSRRPPGGLCDAAGRHQE